MVRRARPCGLLADGGHVVDATAPAICGTAIARYGTPAQKRQWLRGICDGTATMALAITEPDAGDDLAAGEAANVAKYAAAEAAVHAVDAAVQTHGGNGITQEYGMAGMLVAARAGRIAPVSRE